MCNKNNFHGKIQTNFTRRFRRFHKADTEMLLITKILWLLALELEQLTVVQGMVMPAAPLGQT